VEQQRVPREEPTSTPSHPNVVFIVGDNVGWGDLGYFGGTAPTPRIDALAAQGVRLKNYNGVGKDRAETADLAAPISHFRLGA
jgi:hypothetical protein